MTLKQWIKTPKCYVTVTLIAYLLLASIGSRDLKGIVNGIIAVAVSWVLDIILSSLKRNKHRVHDGAIITGLIIGLILGTTTSWEIVAGTAALAILGKHILTYKKKPIFNPAALGLLLSVFIFHSEQSWWGAFGDLPAWTILFLLIGGYFVTNRVNKFPQVFVFLGTTFIFLLIMGLLHVGNAPDALRPPFINATLFFGFFMLTDPPTTPGKNKDQMIFSLLVAVIGTLIYGLFGGLTYLFFGLAVGNLYHLVRKITSKKPAKAQSRAKRSIV